jgi:zinc/manganese transport system substrate-binding protein
MNKIIGVMIIFSVMLGSNFATAQTESKIKAVASFSILGDMVSNIGGERIELFVLVGRNSDGHVYEPTPRDVKQVANADILFINGLHFEGWIERLIEASEFKGKLVVATQGIAPLVTATKAIDPHAWQSLANARVYAKNIAAGLSSLDKPHSNIYKENLHIYLEKIDLAEQEIIAGIAKLPPEHRKVITSHDAFKYFEAAYGLSFDAPQGLSTNAEASATDVVALIRQIRAAKTPAIFLENITDPRLIEQITEETKATIGGTLYSDALSEKNQPADTYLHLMLHNTTLLTEALSH